MTNNEMEYLENTNCNLCGYDDYEVIYTSEKNNSKPGKLNQVVVPHTYLCTDLNRDFGKIVRCRRCGLIYTNPRLKSEIAKQLYINSVDDKYIQEKEERIKSFERVARKCEKITNGGNVLDIGCFCGYFLKALSNNKWRCFGVELSKWGCNYIKKNFGLEIFNGNLFQANYPDKYFDLITMWDVLEHLYNPKETFSEINRILQDNGILCFVVPNINSLMARIFRSKWWSLIQPHVYYFTPHTIKEMLHKTGFRIIKTDTYGRNFTFSYWTTRIEPYSKIIHNFVNKLINALNIDKISLNVDLGDQMKIFANKLFSK